MSISKILPTGVSIVKPKCHASTFTLDFIAVVETKMIKSNTK